MTPSAARQFTAERFALTTAKTVVARIEQRSIQGPGGDIILRIYWPATARKRPPVTLYFHGGGFVVMGLDTHDDICRKLSTMSSSVVVSVDYRLAPEAPFPAAVDDAFAALRWVAGHADILGIDADAIAVAGDSAGANLATVAAMRARDEGGPALAAQLLFYPLLDAGPGDQWDSRNRYGVGFGLTAATVDWFLEQYLPEPEMRSHPHVSPIEAKLEHLPPARIVIAGYDLLQDEAEAYGRRLADASVPVYMSRHPDLNHAFLHWTDQVPSALTALSSAATWLRDHLAKQPVC